MSFQFSPHIKVIVNVGSGGVGKTTVSAAIGLQAAQSGLKVLVITVDPAKRLASTLGINPDGQIHQVNLGSGEGTLFAAVLNSQRIFEEFIYRVAGRSPAAEKLLKNKLFKQLSTTLSGSQEFSSLELLYSQYEKGIFDLIILDTPPTKHAVDFLESPEKISNLFSDQVTKWFRSDAATGGLLANLFSSGTLKVLSALKLLTGSDFVDQLQEFFQSIQGWQGKLSDRTGRVEKLLRSEMCTFNLVTSLSEAKLKEAEYLSGKLRKGEFRLGSIIVNRSFPQWLIAPTGTGSSLDSYLQMLKEYYDQQRDGLKNVLSHFESIEVYSLPEYSTDISDLKGLDTLIADLKRVNT